MLRRVVFFIDYPFDKRDYNRFGIDILKNNGFTVEVWDFTFLLHPLVRRNVTIMNPVECEYSFSNKAEAISSIERITTQDIVVSIIPFKIESLFIYRALSKTKTPYSVFAANSLPHPSTKNSFSILRKIRNITKKNILSLIFLHLPFKWMGVKSTSIVLAGGKESNPVNFPVDRNSTTLWIHTLDYDIYLDYLKMPLEIDEKMAVFLDEYLPFHPDYTYSGLPVPEDVESYYAGLNSFFSDLESRHGFHVVIAAHPRSQYDKHPDYFGGRDVLIENTVELVARAGLVICHSSTSINFAVLFRKPIIFITSNQIQKSWYGSFIESMAGQFGKKPFNLDSEKEIDLSKQIPVDIHLYNEYKRRYIKTEESESFPFWQIFSNYIKEHY